MKNFSRLIISAASLCPFLVSSTLAQVETQLPQASNVLTLEAATDELLRRNLSVEAARFEVSVAEAQIIAAGLRPRPGLTFSGENVPVSGPTPFNRLYEVGATVTQPLELGNRRELRTEVANQSVLLAKAQFTNVLQRQIYELKRAFYEALLRRSLFEITEKNRADFEELLRFNTVRFEEGEISEGELIRVRLERIKFDSAVGSARLTVQQANIRLLELLGDDAYERATTLSVSGALTFEPVVLS